MSGSAQHSGSDRIVVLVSAIIAVLAALGTLFAHHRSISALALKNDAIVTTAKASDQYQTFETKRVRVAMYQTMLAGDVISKPAARKASQAAMDHEQASSLAVLNDAKALERQAAAQQRRSDDVLHSYETLEVATTLFEIAIVLTSISALTGSRPLLWSSIGASAIGVAAMIAGFLQAH